MTREAVALLQKNCVVLPALQAEIWSTRVGPRWQEYEMHQASPLSRSTDRICARCLSAGNQKGLRSRGSFETWTTGRHISRTERPDRPGVLRGGI